MKNAPSTWVISITNTPSSRVILVKNTPPSRVILVINTPSSWVISIKNTPSSWVINIKLYSSVIACMKLICCHAFGFQRRTYHSFSCMSVIDFPGVFLAVLKKFPCMKLFAAWSALVHLLLIRVCWISPLFLTRPWQRRF